MSKVEGEVVYWRPTGSICIYKTQIFIYLSIVTELKLNVKINQDTTRKKNLLQFLLTKKVVEKRSLKFVYQQNNNARKEYYISLHSPPFSQQTNRM